MIRLVLIIMVTLLTLPAQAQNGAGTALKSAVEAFDKAQQQLGSELFGVDIKAYGDALKRGRFTSAYWGGTVAVEIVAGADNEVGCQRFAAYVPLPPRDGQAVLVICPEFSTPGTESLRRLTILHEMVHVVAGPDECRAMAFSAHIEKLALGRVTPVERYWQANKCQNLGFRLP